MGNTNIPVARMITRGESEIPNPLGTATLYVEHGGISLRFATNPGGQKKSGFQHWVTPDSFALLAEAMMRADPAAAVKAFGMALQLPLEAAKTWVPPTAAPL
jgi:hypothetical protein